MVIQNKLLLFLSLLFMQGLLQANQQVLIKDLFELPCKAETLTPENLFELQNIVTQASSRHKKIALIGANKSMGGQTQSYDDGAWRVSLDKINKLKNLNVQDKLVTVEAGMTWGQLQSIITPHGLAIKAMQSFKDFSIGGSLSVNVHGQDLKEGQLINSVHSFTLLMTDGSLKTVTRAKDPELFSLVVGGYGLFGIIIEVTLELTEDKVLERKAVTFETKDFASFFKNNVQDNPNIEFWSVRFSLGSNDLYTRALSITYEATDQGSPKDLVIKEDNYQLWALKAFGLVKPFKVLNNVRFDIEAAFFKRPKLISRNNFMNGSIKRLPQNNKKDMYILQEYFIPYDNVNSFLEHFAALTKQYNINILNITARHVGKDTNAFLSFAPQDACALVLYIRVPKKDTDYLTTAIWTSKLLDKCLDLNGVYYLPYQLLATRDQLERAYPQVRNFMDLKRKYDPLEILTNKMYEHYAY